MEAKPTELPKEEMHLLALRAAALAAVSTLASTTVILPAIKASPIESGPLEVAAFLLLSFLIPAVFYVLRMRWPAQGTRLRQDATTLRPRFAWRAAMGGCFGLFCVSSLLEISISLDPYAPKPFLNLLALIAISAILAGLFGLSLYLWAGLLWLRVDEPQDGNDSLLVPTVIPLTWILPLTKSLITPSLLESSISIAWLILTVLVAGACGLFVYKRFLPELDFSLFKVEKTT